MRINTQQYWNREYTKQPTLGDYVHQDIRKVAEDVPPGRVLELGCGIGTNLLYLAERGFEVEGVDISSVAIERFQSTADSKGLKVKAEVKDLNEYSIQGEYDVIYSLRTLQYVDQSTGSRLVDEMRISTRKHGVNIIEAFRNLPPFSEEEPNYCTFKERELELRYGLWHILVYEEPELETPKKDKNDTIISQTGAFIAAMNTPRMYKWVV